MRANVLAAEWPFSSTSLALLRTWQARHTSHSDRLLKCQHHFMVQVHSVLLSRALKRDRHILTADPNRKAMKKANDRSRETSLGPRMQAQRAHKENSRWKVDAADEWILSLGAIRLDKRRGTNQERSLRPARRRKTSNGGVGERSAARGHDRRGKSQQNLRTKKAAHRRHLRGRAAAEEAPLSDGARRRLARSEASARRQRTLPTLPQQGQPPARASC